MNDFKNYVVKKSPKGSGEMWTRSSDGSTSDGSTASYYELPEGASELQHLISHKDMNAQWEKSSVPPTGTGNPRTVICCVTLKKYAFT